MGTIYKSGIEYGGSSLIDGGTTGQVLAKKSDANQDVEWIDPPESIVDTAMSDESENAVQNKVIKKYVDAELDKKADITDTYTKTETDKLLNKKQDALTAGDGIKIEDDVISGTKVDVSKGETNIIEVESYNSSKLGFEFREDDVVLTASSPMVFGENRMLQEKLTAGEGITIDNNTISANAGVFVAVYEQTSYADVKAAIDAHKVIVLDMPANNNQFCVTYSTYINGGNVLMYAIYKMSDKATLMTATLTPDNNWTITHTDLQDKLVSGTNIKTVNNTSLLGSGNIDAGRGEFIAIIESTSFADVKAAIDANKFIILQDNADKTRIPSTTIVSNNSITFGTTNGNTLSRVTVNNNDVWTVDNIRMSDKQDKLVSGTNIKTINNQSLLGSGNINIGGDVFLATGGKTISEIMEAYSAGKVIIAEFSNKYYTVSYIKQEMPNKIVLYSLYTHETLTIPPTDAYAIATFTVTDDGGSPPITTWGFDSIDIQEALYSGKNIKTINNTSLLGSGNIDIQGGGGGTLLVKYEETTYDALKEAYETGMPVIVDDYMSFEKHAADIAYMPINPPEVDGYEVHFLDGSYPYTWQCVQTNGVVQWTEVKGNQFADILMTGELTNLITTDKSNLVSAINEVYEKSGEPFRVKQWGSNTLNVVIPTCTEDIDNTSIPKMVFTIDNVEGADYQIVGMLAYEVFDAASGGNRINCWPVCQFTGNGQKELSVRWMCGGTTRKTAKRINAWVLLKHR